MESGDEGDMLAAGFGTRHRNSRTFNLSKIFLRFSDRSLLQRHIDILKRNGIEEPIRDVILTSGRETGQMSNHE